MSKQLRVLVVDDTITYRNILKAALSGLCDVEVVGTASNGEIALEKISQLQPDLVTLDIEMPVMDGLQALDQIKKRFPNVGVIMVSSANQSSADATIRALGHGALDFIRKPEGSDIDDSINSIRSSLKLMIEAFLAQQARPESAPQQYRKTVTSAVQSQIKGFDLLAIGSSTGGPNALMQILPLLPADFHLPIVVVQHMPEGFTESFARNLDSKCKVAICEAKEGDSIRQGSVVIAPGGRHMTFKRVLQGTTPNYVVALDENPPVNNCRPAVDVTFQSLSKCFQGNILSVILTGMGTDGVNGIRAMKQHTNCYCITQNEESCVVYGMPRAVDNESLSDISLHLNDIGRNIIELVGTQSYVSS